MSLVSTPQEKTSPEKKPQPKQDGRRRCAAMRGLRRWRRRSRSERATSRHARRPKRNTERRRRRRRRHPRAHICQPGTRSSSDERAERGGCWRAAWRPPDNKRVGPNAAARFLTPSPPKKTSVCDAPRPPSEEEEGERRGPENTTLNNHRTPTPRPKKNHPRRPRKTASRDNNATPGASTLPFRMLARSLPLLQMVARPSSYFRNEPAGILSANKGLFFVGFFPFKSNFLFCRERR